MLNLNQCVAKYHILLLLEIFAYYANNLKCGNFWVLIIKILPPHTPTPTPHAPSDSLRFTLEYYCLVVQIISHKIMKSLLFIFYSLLAITNATFTRVIHVYVMHKDNKWVMNLLNYFNFNIFTTIWTFIINGPNYHI